jgi:ribosome biogenesis GTPase
LIELGFTSHIERLMREVVGLSDRDTIGRVRRIDRGWSTYLCVRVAEVTAVASDQLTLALTESRVRNLGADVAVGDWIVVSHDGERVVSVLPRRSQLVRRASSDDGRAVPQTIAANIDVVFVVHSLDNVPNQRRLERELVLAFDSGARPVVVLTKSDIVADAHSDEVTRLISATSFGVPVHVVSSVTGDGLPELQRYVDVGETAVVLGASGAGKSTLINALTGTNSQQTGEVRVGDGRGRHTTIAADLVALPNRGWLIDTPGIRTLGLWTSGHGIERAFADVFGLAERCRFRDCKHHQEPDCAVRSAIATGHLEKSRLDSMIRLVEEEAALEREQRNYNRR